jgi:hypothetical protein
MIAAYSPSSSAFSEATGKPPALRKDPYRYVSESSDLISIE